MTVISVALGRTFHYVDELLPFRFFLYFLDLFTSGMNWLYSYKLYDTTGKVNTEQYNKHCITYMFEKTQDPNIVFQCLLTNHNTVL